MATCPTCSRTSPPDPATGYDGPDYCSAACEDAAREDLALLAAEDVDYTVEGEDGAVSIPFAGKLYSEERRAIAEAQALADGNGTPCGVWRRDGWYTVCEHAPDSISPDPTMVGWQFWAIVDPRDEPDALIVLTEYVERREP